MTLTARITAAVAGIALSVTGSACTQSMPASEELTEKWSDKTLFDIETRTLEGKPLKLSEWKGKAVLVVNVASRCGFTGQYAGLEKLSDQWKNKGLVVVGIPCNDFGGQEPGSASTIREFCTTRYEVDFPMLEKQSTKPGRKQSPIYEYLGTRTGKLPGWNFCKYLVYPDGRTIEFYNSSTAPDGKQLEAKIKDAVSKVKPADTANSAKEDPAV